MLTSLACHACRQVTDVHLALILSLQIVDLNKLDPGQSGEVYVHALIGGKEFAFSPFRARLIAGRICLERLLLKHNLIGLSFAVTSSSSDRPPTSSFELVLEPEQAWKMEFNNTQHVWVDCIDAGDASAFSTDVTPLLSNPA